MIVTFEGEYKGQKIDAEIDVQPANLYAWITYSDLDEQAELVEDRLWRRARKEYALLMGGSPHGKLTVDEQAINWPPSFEMVSELPIPLLSQWQEAVFTENPYWRSGKEAGEKKA